MNIFELLKSDHRAVSRLMEQLGKTSEKRPEHREKLFMEFKREMEIHSRAEENAVYYPLQRIRDTRDLAMEAEEEHKVVDYLLKELNASSKSDPTWGPKMNVLRQLIENHIEEEESEMFKKMHRDCTADELKSMAHDMDALKKRFSMGLVGTLLRKIA